MGNTASLKKEYAERIAPALKNQFKYSSTMQIPVLKKIVINQGLGMAVADKKIIDVAINELTAITGQKAVATVSRKDIANFKLRKKTPIGVMVTLRRERMYEFLEKLVRVACRVSVTSKVLKVSLTVVVTIPWVFRSKSFSRKSISIALPRLWV